MPKNYSTDKKGQRSYDRESGMNRTKGSKGKRHQAPPPIQESSEDENTTDSDAEELAMANTRDDSVRKTKKPSRPLEYRGKPVQSKNEAQEADEEEVEEVKKPEVTTSSHFTFLVAMTRQIAPKPISYPTINEYVPDCGNMFMVIYHMTNLIGNNLRLIELSPEYTSIGLNLYYSHVYYYHILRARMDCGTITRFERRSLKLYETVGKPEAWPIATPLIGFIQALGYVEIPNKMYSRISPKFPTVKEFTLNKGLTNLHNVAGMGRAPIVPAYQEFLRRFAHNITHYDENTAIYTPAKTPLTVGRTETTFLGLEASLDTSKDFQALAFNQGWNTSAETEEPVGQFSLGQRQTRIKRWSIPAVMDTANFQELEGFLFGNGEHVEWMRQLLKMSNAINKHFPGSTNLGAIPPLTTIETFTHVTYDVRNARTVTADVWNQPRRLWTMSFTSPYFGPEVNTLVQASTATSVNSNLSSKIIPADLSSGFEPCHSGPYFTDTDNDRSRPLREAEGQDNHDPTQRIEELISSVMYNAQGSE